MAVETEKTAETPAEEVKDEPVDLEAPATAEETKDEPKAEGEGETEVAGEEEAGEEGKPPKKLSGAQRHKLREQRLLNELSQRDREIEELRRATPAQAGETQEQDKPPEEKDFPDWFAWQRALTAYDAGRAAKKAIDSAFQSREEIDRKARQAEIARQRATDHAERVEEAREVIADFDEIVAETKGVNVRNDVIDEIMSSDKSALLTYYLAKNPDKLQALNQMAPRELAREIGRLEGSIRMPAAKKQTTAPPPIKPLKGGAAGAFDPEAASMDDYVARRQSGWKG